MAGTVDAVLFDLGGVFTESPFAAAEALGRRLGADPQRVLEIVFGPYHEDTDHPWHRLERGEVTLEAAREEILVIGEGEGARIDPYEVLGALAAGHQTRDAVVDCVYAIRRGGLKTALVTNNAMEFRDAWRSMLPFDEMFDVIVDSCELGVRKPDARIFHTTLRLLGGVAPERAVFLDDFAGNVRAARAIGMHAIHVERDPAPALRELASLVGIEIGGNSAPSS